MKGKVIAVVNQKGGVAKTTTVLALGNGLAKSGKKVLLVDFDPQGSLTSFLGIDTENLATALEWLGVQKKYARNFREIVISVQKNLDIIPADISLETAPGFLHAKPGASNYLKVCIDAIREKYDYIIIDTSPSLSVLTINALVASDELIVPFKPEDGSRKGINLLLNTILDVKVLNSTCHIAGFIVVMYDKRRKNSLRENLEYIYEVAANNGTQVFDAKIRLSASATKITKEDIFSPKSAVAEDYDAFVKEYINNKEI